VTARQLSNVASDTARSIRRRLAAAAAPQPAPRFQPEPLPEPDEVDSRPAADEAGLDSLRGELVRELDRLAAADDDCSAVFRRV
jgi:hypothetical protein